MIKILLLTSIIFMTKASAQGAYTITDKIYTKDCSKDIMSCSNYGLFSYKVKIADIEMSKLRLMYMAKIPFYYNGVEVKIAVLPSSFRYQREFLIRMLNISYSRFLEIVDNNPQKFIVVHNPQQAMTKMVHNYVIAVIRDDYVEFYQPVTLNYIKVH